MFRRRIWTAVAVVVVSVGSIAGLAWRGNAYAAQTAVVGGNALKISPVRLDVTGDPGTTQTLDVYITNVSDVQATLHPEVDDFVAAGDESGHPDVLLDEKQYAPSHSLKRFASPLNNFTLAAGEEKDIRVPITIPKNAAGGGYYGAVRFSPTQALTSKSLSLTASVGTIVLLKVNGAISEKMSLASFDIRRADKPGTFFTNNKKLSAVIRFNNTGNIQLEPFGTLTVKRFGKVVQQTQINNSDPRGNVLPDSIRRFTTPLTKLGSFGKYTLEGNFGYGTTGQLLTSSMTFYIVPVPLILVGVAVLLILLFLIFIVPRLIRSYNQRVIRRASRRR